MLSFVFQSFFLCFAVYLKLLLIICGHRHHREFRRHHHERRRTRRCGHRQSLLSVLHQSHRLILAVWEVVVRQVLLAISGLWDATTAI
jgi:hypothetical protein